MTTAGLDLGAILRAQPDVVSYGYGPGPWPIRVRNFVPSPANAKWKNPHIITAAQNHEFPEVQRINVSREWRGVCMVELIEGTNVMCGQQTKFQSRKPINHFWRHMRQLHTGAVTIPGQGTGVSGTEKLHHDLLQRRFVLTGQWRNARFQSEPGRGPPGYALTRIADEFEQLAAADGQFAAVFGTKFHRRHPNCPEPEPQETGIDLLLRAAAALEYTR